MSLQRELDARFRRAPVSMTTLVVAVALTLLRWAQHDTPIVAALAGSPEDVWNGRLWVLVTSTLFHGDPIHLLFNLAWVWTMWTELEAHTKWWRALAFGVGSAAFSSAAELLVLDQSGIGLSGVGYAVFGLAWARSRSHVPSARVITPDSVRLWLGWGVLCLFLTHLGVWNIANAAHGGGLAFGWIAGRILVRDRRAPAPRQLWIAAAAILAGATVALCVLGPPWSRTWHAVRAWSAIERGDANAAIPLLERSLALGADQDWGRANLLWAYWNAGRMEDHDRLLKIVDRENPNIMEKRRRDAEGR